MKRSIRLGSAYVYVGGLAALAWLSACGGPAQPPAANHGISISFPAAGQVLAGTVPLAARGTTSGATGISFEIGGITTAARTDGTAYLDTRQLVDGQHTLIVTGTVAGASVETQRQVMVNNDLSATGAVGAAGGGLMSDLGSIASIQPGALATTADVSVRDTTQQEILTEFGVDYPALGVTFLGAMTIDTNGAQVGLPVSVDLAGWANAVQPGQDVVMFALAPDADGDGVGELVLAASAEATQTGSVITRPVPAVEMYTQPQGMSAQQATAARPGELMRLSGRGLNLLAALSNVARYGSPASPIAETLTFVETSDPGGFDPLLDVWVAVPNLPGSQAVRVHNLTTGYRTAPLDVNVGQAGSGSSADWAGFVEQVDAAIEVATTDRADLENFAGAWLEELAGHGGNVAAAMAGNSGLVSSANMATVKGITPGALTMAERRLVAHHALVLDAVAASVPEISAAAADLATLIATSWAGSSLSAAGISTQQADGPSCNGGGSTPTAGLTWGNPVTTGMGSAPPGSCVAGGGSGPGWGGPASLPADITTAAAALDEAALATTSLRGGSFRPVHGAVIVVYRPNSSQRLAPFTALTDQTGFFKVPFVPPGEPYVVRGIDPATGLIAEAIGQTAGVGVASTPQLLFTATDSGPGSPTAGFSISSVPDPNFEGSVYYDFDGSASGDDGEIVEYVWYFDGFTASVGDDPTTRRGFGRNGSYTIRLTVIDDEGKFGTSQQTLVIDDLPYDYWGLPPDNVATFADGSAIPAETEQKAVAMTPDGRYVAFSVGGESPYEHADLLPGDDNGLRDVYIKDMQTGQLGLASEAVAGVYTSAEHVSLSADGRFIAYVSQQTLDGSRPRVHVRDLQTGDLETIAFEDAIVEIGPGSLTADGSKLLYEISYSGVDSATADPYVLDLVTGETTRLTGFQDVYEVHAITPSGSHALIAADAGLWVVDLDTLQRSSVTSNSDGVSSVYSGMAWGQSMSADGRFVVFASPSTDLVDRVTTEFRDHVYLKDLSTEEVTLLTSNPLTGAEADNPSRHPVITPDGRYVYFITYAENLVPKVQHLGPGLEFDGCSLRQCPSELLLAYEVDSQRFAAAEVGFDHTAACCDVTDRTIAVADGYVAFGSSNAQLVGTGEDDVMRVFRALNPFGAP